MVDVERPLAELYRVECKTINGGYCENSAARHLGELRVMPDVAFEYYVPYIMEQIKNEAQWYVNSWGVDPEAVKITFKTDIYDHNSKKFNLYFDGHIIAKYKIADHWDKIYKRS